MDKKALRLDLYKQILMDSPEIPESVKSYLIPGADAEMLDQMVIKYNIPLHERAESVHFQESEGMPEIRKQIMKEFNERKEVPELLNEFHERENVRASLCNLTQKKYSELQKLMRLVKEAQLNKDSSFLRALFSNIQNLLAPWLWNTKIGEALRLIQAALDEADRIENQRSKAFALPSIERQKVMKEHPEWFR